MPRSQKPLDYECPFCHARPGRPCIRLTGRRDDFRDAPHLARMDRVRPPPAGATKTQDHGKESP